jgi:hypothetical protein
MFVLCGEDFMSANFTKEGDGALEKQVRAATSPSELYTMLSAHLEAHRPTTEVAAAPPLNVTSRPVPEPMRGTANFFQVAYRDNDRIEIYAETPKEFEAKLQEARTQGWFW